MKLEVLLEQKKREIEELEKGVGWKRVKGEKNLYQEWQEKYNRYIAQKTPQKLIIPKLKLKVIDPNGDFVSNLESLRHLLEDELRELGIKKIRYRSEFKIANSLFFPYLFKCGEFKDTFYKVDIKSCFYSIYSRLGVDCKVILETQNSNFNIKAVAKGRLTAQESELIKMLEQDKKLRNSVYGLTRCAFYTQLIPLNTIERKFFRGKLQNLDLTVIIAAFLHNLVKKFRKYIIYWNIDGGIIYPEGYEIMKNYLKEMGFNLRKEGEGEAVILGLGSYKCGEFATEHFLNGICAHIQEKEYILNFKGVEKIEKWLARIERI